MSFTSPSIILHIIIKTIKIVTGKLEQTTTIKKNWKKKLKISLTVTMSTTDDYILILKVIMSITSSHASIQAKNDINSLTIIAKKIAYV